jgi:hypothetical protein
MSLLKRAIVMVAAVIAGAGFAAAPAQAAWSDCPDYYFCIWTSTNATGARFQYHYNTFVDSYHNGIRLGSGVANRGFSFYNRTHVWVGIFDSNNCVKAPWWRTMNNNQYATTQGSDWGGRVSSVQLGNAIPAGGDTTDPSLPC